MKKQIISAFIAALILTTFAGCSEVKTSSGESISENSSVIFTENISTTSSTTQTSSSLQSNSSGNSPSVEINPFYDDVFVDFIEDLNPSIAPPMTYDDVMEVMTSPLHDGLDSYYLVEAIELMELSDAEKLRGFEDWYYKLNGMKYDGVHYGCHVIYKVKVIEDLITGEDCNKELLIDLSFYAPMYQNAGNPPYAPGEKFTVALFKKAEGCDITQSGAGYFFRFDIEETDNGLKALVRAARSEIIGTQIVELTRASKTKITSTTANPVQYVAEFELSDLVDFLRRDWAERGVSHFEKT